MRNSLAAQGPSFLDRVSIAPAPDLGASLRAFESGEDDLGWLGLGLHEPRRGAVAFDAGALGWAILRTGEQAGRWNAPGVAQRLADGIDPSRLAHLGVRADWTVQPDDGWGGPPASLLVRADSPWLLDLARAVAVALSRPGHEVTPAPTPPADFARARSSGAYALALDLARPFDPTPLGVYIGLVTSEDPVRGAQLARHPPLGGIGRRAPHRRSPLAGRRRRRRAAPGGPHARSGAPAGALGGRNRLRGNRFASPERSVGKPRMRLAPRLVLAFGGLTALSTVGLGWTLREQLRQDGSDRFGRDVAAACESVKAEVYRQAESDRKLVAAACRSGELVDRVITWTESGELANQRVSIGTALVPNERAAFDQDELTLTAGKGEILGADPLDLVSRPRADLEAMLRGPADRFSLRTASPAATVTRCARSRAGHEVALVAARHLGPLLDRLRAPLKVTGIAIGTADGQAPPTLARATCALEDGVGSRLPIVVTKDKAELYATWAYIDRTVALASAAATGLALLLAVLLARSLGRPLADARPRGPQGRPGPGQPDRRARIGRDRRSRAGLRPDAGRPRRDPPQARGDDARGGVARGRAPGRARGQEPARPHPRRRRDPQAPARPGGPRLRRVLRRGHPHGARRGAPHLGHRDRVHPLRPPAGAKAAGRGPRAGGERGRNAPQARRRGVRGRDRGGRGGAARARRPRSRSCSCS